jgi:hypothetical protein
MIEIGRIDIATEVSLLSSYCGGGEVISEDTEDDPQRRSRTSIAHDVGKSSLVEIERIRDPK